MKRILLIILILATAIGLMAQMPQDPTYGLTPNAKSFQRYGDIPVSLYTGTPSINIPLDTINDGSLSLPISLSYHSGGVKADEHPGWVGLGWTLMLGGAITRELRGYPDEYYEDEYKRTGYYQRCKSSNTGYEYDYNSEMDKWLSDKEEQKYIAFDFQPDKFNFNFCNYIGFFMLDTSGKWQIQSNRPLKIIAVDTISHPTINTYDYIHRNRIFSRFTLLGEDGTKYILGDTTAIDYSVNIATQVTGLRNVLTWHLKKIIYPNNDSIVFNYNRGDYIANISYRDQLIALVNPKGLRQIASYTPFDGVLIRQSYLTSIIGKNFHVKLHNSISNELDYDEIYYSHRLFERPISNEDKIYFHRQAPYIYGTNYEFPVLLYDCSNNTIGNRIAEIKWHKLDSIVFYNRNYAPYKTIKFRYNNIPSARLALEKLEFCNLLGQTKSAYCFKYKNLDDMPKYMSMKTDQWGYYNGDSITEDLFRLPNENTLAYGTLQEIIYPNGGRTIFDFEPHSYSKITNKVYTGDLVDVDEAIAGGVRIRKITTVPNDGTPALIREFKYTHDYLSTSSDKKSSGILEGFPINYRNVTTNGSTQVITGAYSALSNIISTTGLHIAYPEVVELKEDGGFEVHRFTSCLDLTYRDQITECSDGSSIFLPTTSLAAYRGFPVSLSCYNSAQKLIRQIH